MAHPKQWGRDPVQAHRRARCRPSGEPDARRADERAETGALGRETCDPLLCHPGQDQSFVALLLTELAKTLSDVTGRTLYLADNDL